MADSRRYGKRTTLGRSYWMHRTAGFVRLRSAKSFATIESFHLHQIHLTSLQAGSVDVLHCYYAHGEDNENFQRRSYWMLDVVSATLAGEKAVETVVEQSIVPLDGGREDQLSLKDSLAAVRNSAQAAARIQAAFRVHSFRRKQMIEYGDDKCGMSDEEALSFISVQSSHKLGHYNEALHTAAVRIQRKFRGWKGRKEFLIIRNRIVKIQAHIRGHQVRKQYKKVVWSVGIVEKAILRWRRKRVGLRGFKAEGAIEDSDGQNCGQSGSDDYDFLRAGRKQMEAGVEKALARVQSMVQYPEARDQYRRLLTNFQETKDGLEGAGDGDSKEDKENKTNEDDVLMSMTD